MFTTLSAMVVACAMLLPNASVFAASYSQELQDAYNWAYSKSITTMSPIDNANMYGAITRAELAKMLANWAKDKGQTPDTSVACNFTDTASVKGDLAVAIVESCQLGLMGQGISAFRPYDTISRAEFGTALSRALWGNQYEGGTPYYAKHLDALKAAGIMTQIANAESTKEVRGYVMLMLMRSEGNEAVVDCDDPMTVIACTTDTDACPAACKEAEDNTPSVVKAGELALTAKAAEGRKVISDGTTSYLDTLTLKVSEDVTVNSITLERYGYSTTADVDSIWLEDSEGNIISSEKSLSPSKDSVTLSLKKDYRTFSDKDTITIAVKTATVGDGENDIEKHGENIGFKVTDVDCSAKDVNLDDYTAYLYDIIDYDGSEVTVELKGKDGKSYNVAAGESYEVAKLKISATNSAIDVNGFTLTNGGDLDLSDNVEDVTVKVDGEDVKGLTYTIKKDTLKVNFNTAKIGIKKNSLFTVYVTLNDEFEDYNDTVKFYLENTSDLKALETKNGTTVKFSTRSAYEEDDAFTYTFVGGKVTLTNTKLASSIDAAAGSDDVVIAQWSINLWGEPININNLTITPSLPAMVEAIKIYVDDEEFEADKNYKFKDILIEKNATIKVAVDLEDDSESEYAWQTITFKIENTQSINATTLKAADGNVEYENSGEPVAKANIAGSITISSIKVNESKATLKNNVTKEAEFVRWQTTKKTIFEWTYTAKKSDVDLNEVALIYGNAGEFVDTDTVTIDVLIDGEPVATLDADDLLPSTTDVDNIDESDYVDFSDVTVKAGKSVSVKVVADIYADNSEDANETFEAQKMTLVLRGDDANGIAAGRAKATTVKLKITDSESIKVTDTTNSAKKTVVLQDSDIVLAQFIVKPSNTSDEVDLTNLVLTFTNFKNLDVENLEVTVNDDPVSLDADDLEEGVLTMDDISYNVPSEWVVVEVRYVDELAATTSAAPYTVELTEANTSKPKTLFTRYVVPSLVTFEQTCVDTDCATTKFTVNVDSYDDSYTVSNLELVYEGDGSEELADVQDGKVIEINGSSDGAKFVTEVHYVVNTNEEDAEPINVDIEKGEYNDYFYVKGAYLKVAKAK